MSDSIHQRTCNGQPEFDMNLLLHATRAGWRIPHSTKQKALSQLNSLLDKEDVSDRDKINVIRTLGLLDKIDLEEMRIAATLSLQREAIDVKKSNTQALIHKLQQLLTPEQIQHFSNEIPLLNND